MTYLVENPIVLLRNTKNKHLVHTKEEEESKIKKTPNDSFAIFPNANGTGTGTNNNNNININNFYNNNENNNKNNDSLIEIKSKNLLDHSSKEYESHLSSVIVFEEAKSKVNNQSLGKNKANSNLKFLNKKDNLKTNCINKDFFNQINYYSENSLREKSNFLKFFCRIKR